MGRTSMLDRLAKVRGGGLLELTDDHGADLRGGVLGAPGLQPGIAVGGGRELVRDLVKIFLDLGILELSTDQTLGGEEGIFGIDDRLPLRWLADETLAVLGEGHDGRHRPSTLGILDHPRGLAFHDGHARGGRPEVNL